MRNLITRTIFITLLADPVWAQTARNSAAVSEADAPQTFVTVSYTLVAPETLERADVYDANDEEISDVSSVIVTREGTVKNLVFSIGGMWGIGGKPIIVPIREVQIMRDPAGDDVRVYVNARKETLALLPEYDD